jgi:hypothetical protein
MRLLASLSGPFALMMEAESTSERQLSTGLHGANNTEDSHFLMYI